MRNFLSDKPGVKALLIESKEETEKEPSQDSQHPAQHNDPVQPNVHIMYSICSANNMVENVLSKDITQQFKLHKTQQES